MEVPRSACGLSYNLGDFSLKLQKMRSGRSREYTQWAYCTFTKLFLSLEYNLDSLPLF